MNPTTTGAAWIVCGTSLIALSDNFVTGLAGITATGCQARGYMSGASSIMGLFEFSFLAWAPLFACILWGDTVGPRMALGMALIVVAGSLAIWSGARAEPMPAA